jgi:hypothetical protein
MLNRSNSKVQTPILWKTMPTPISGEDTVHSRNAKIRGNVWCDRTFPQRTNIQNQNSTPVRVKVDMAEGLVRALAESSLHFWLCLNRLARVHRRNCSNSALHPRDTSLGLNTGYLEVYRGFSQCIQAQKTPWP